MTDRPPIHYTRTGDGAAVPLILGPSIGTSLGMWDAALPALAADRAVIRYDLPGHGGTPATALPDLKPGATTVADLAQAVLDLADNLAVERFAYAGVSLGGAIGLWLAIHRPERIAALAALCSSARFGDPSTWLARADLVRRKGTGPVADTTAERWFTPSFAASGAPVVAHLVNDLRAAEPDGYAACCDALAAFDVREDLARITAPTLVIAGRDDPATPVAQARELADGIPNAALLEVPHASHLVNVEQPRTVVPALRAHFATAIHPSPLPSSPRQLDSESSLAAGMTVRRAVLGDAHVDRAVAGTTPFTADFQDFITRYAWGGIWTRPGLDRRTRSAITLTA
ncbi:MAG: 3-oxoadipate enol-lactonase, partial [Actinocrinis sp.]